VSPTHIAKVCVLVIFLPSCTYTDFMTDLLKEKSSQASQGSNATQYEEAKEEEEEEEAEDAQMEGGADRRILKSILYGDGI
jgi:hypothetical protein